MCHIFFHAKSEKSILSAQSQINFFKYITGRQPVLFKQIISFAGLAKLILDTHHLNRHRNITGTDIGHSITKSIIDLMLFGS